MEANNSSVKKVLILEDEHSIFGVYNTCLKKKMAEKIDVFWAKTKQEGLVIAEKNKLDLMIIDLNLPDGCGMDFLEKIREKRRNIPAIIISGVLNNISVKWSRDLGAVCAIQKPCPIEMFVKVVGTILRNEKAVGLTHNEKANFVYMEPVEDGSYKCVAYDGNKPVEFAGLNEQYRKRFTICLSSQYGCKMGCRFCVTGTKLNKDVSNLSWRSMLAKVRIAELYYGYEYLEKEIIFAGEGEPSLNIRNIRILTEILSAEGFKFRLSTVGLVKTLPRLTKELAGVLKELQVSVHFPSDELRKIHMSSAQKNSLRDILPLVERFAEKSGKKVVLNFTLFRGMNDSLQMAERIVELIDTRPFIAKISRCNPYGIYRMSNLSRENDFEELIKQGGIETERFASKGRSEVKNSSIPCGQMAAEIGLIKN